MKLGSWHSSNNEVWVQLLRFQQSGNLSCSPIRVFSCETHVTMTFHSFAHFSFENKLSLRSFLDEFPDGGICACPASPFPS